MNKVNHFVTAPCKFIFLSSLSNTNGFSLVANLGKTSLAKETARFHKAILPKLLIILPNVLPRNPPD